MLTTTPAGTPHGFSADDAAPLPAASSALNAYHYSTIAMFGLFGSLFFFFGSDPLEPHGFFEHICNLWSKDGGDMANWYAHVVGLLFFLIATTPLFGVSKLSFARWTLVINLAMVFAMIHGAFNSDASRAMGLVHGGRTSPFGQSCVA